MLHGNSKTNKETLAFLIVSPAHKATVKLNLIILDCISLHKLPREIPKELFEEDTSHRVCDECMENRRCNIFYLKGMDSGIRFQGDSPISASEHLKDVFSDFLI